MSAGGVTSGVVGRDQELGMVDEFLDAMTQDCRVLVMDGVAGIGKTTLWLEALRRATQRGLRVLSCRPVEAETAFAGAALCDLLEEVSDEALAVLPGPQQRALRVALLRAEPGAAPLEARVVAAGFRSLLETMSDAGGVVVAIDDEQWLDKASATAIAFALRRVVTAPVGWLFTHRVGTPHRIDIGRLIEPGRFTRVTVGPLTVGALHGVLKARVVDLPLTRPTLVRVHGAS